MSKVAVVYWSGTGNTEQMANIISEGIIAAGGEAAVMEVSAASLDELKAMDAFALGCPSMGDEVLEEDAMEPFVEAVCAFAKDKQIGLFGSYGWGNCEWMRDWEARMQEAGATVINGEGITVLGEPDEETTGNLKALGDTLARV